MSNADQTYINALVEILETGEKRLDRTGVGTIGLFGMNLKFDLTRGFPAITTKKLAWKSVVSELLWFISGSGDERKLKEILYGDMNSDKKTIWSDNESATYWQRRKKFSGDLGRVYGVQWRTWRAPVFGANRMGIKHVDQLTELINNIKKDPYSRRHILSAWNPGELELMALPPCHMMAQFYVSSNNKLSCQMYQRSMDVPLGGPFNIASYALLTHMIAQVCGLVVGELIICLGDAHIYSNQIVGIKEQIARKSFPLPEIRLNPDITDITKFTMTDIDLINYQSHPTINFPFSV
jgi:thymidylate synthase